MENVDQMLMVPGGINADLKALQSHTTSREKTQTLVIQKLIRDPTNS